MKTKYLFLIALSVALIFLHSFAEAQLSPPTLTATAVSSSQIDLNWVDPNNKESGVEIQRLNPSTGQFQTIATVVKQETSYSNTGLNAGTQYSYRLMPFFKSEYVYSNIASATTLGGSTPTIPIPPSNLSATAVSSSQINLTWADNSSNETGFKIDRATSSSGPWSQIAVVGANTTSYQNTSLSASTTYYYHVHAYNTAGDSAACSTASATTQSGSADPDAPSNLTANAVSTSQINSNWIDNSSNENGFEIERAPSSGGPWSNIATLGANATSYSNTGLSSATTYYYRARAYTQTKIRGKWVTEYTAYSNIDGATTQGASDTTPPPAPIGLSATPNTWTNSNSFSINWTNPSDPSGIAGAYYKLGAAPTSNTNGTYTTSKPFAVSATSQGGQTIYIWLKDGSGNTSYLNRSSTTLYYDGTAPTDGTLSATAGNAQVTLSGSGFSDSGGSGLRSTNTYKVMRNTGTYPNIQCTSGTQIYLGSGSSITDTGLTNGTTYYYRACAYDNAGNVSTGATSYATPAATDTTPPTGSIIINNNGAYTNTTSVTLTLSATDATSGVSQMCISNTTSCSTWEAYATTKAWTLTSGDGTKTVRVWFKDNAGNTNTSPYSDSIILDTTAPQPVTGLTATAISSSQINLSWGPSFDTGGSGLAGYKVYRPTTQIGTTTATNYSDTGRSANTQYCYQVASYDNAGNTSAKCTQVCATTQGSQQGGGDTIWAERFGSSGKDKGWAVVVDHQGNVIITGQFAYDVDFGGGPLSSSSPWQLTSIFVAKYSPDGMHLGSTSLETGPSADSWGRGIAVDSNNNIVITGACVEFLRFNGTTLYAHGFNIPDICVTKFSSTGVPLWAKVMGSYGLDEGLGIALDSNDNILLTGSFSGTVDFGGGSLTSASSNNDIFLVKYSPTGSHLWSKRFGDVTGSKGYSVAVDSNDNVLLTGVFSGTVNFGGGSRTSAGSTDAFLAKFSSTGSHLWSKGFGGNSFDGGNSVAVDGSGNAYVTGYFRDTVDFGGGSLISAGGDDIFIAKYSPTGSHLWSKRFGGTYDQEATAIAVDGSGDITVTGPFRNMVDFGGGPFYTYGYLYSDIFIAKLSPAGSHLWSNNFGYGDMDSQTSTSVAVDYNSGNSVVTGFFTGTTDFGTGPLTSYGDNDIFLLKLAP